jgi:hypothetical protein
LTKQNGRAGIAFSEHSQRNRKAEQVPCRAHESQRHGFPLRRDPFVSVLKGFVLEKRQFVANLSADSDFFA